MIPLKSEADLLIMAKAGKILAGVLERLEEEIAPGITTKEIDSLAEELILKEGAKCAFKGYRGFPSAICASINEEIVHGIPCLRKLKEGDIMSLDVGVTYEGFFSDAAITVPVGDISPKVKKLVDCARESLNEGIKFAREDFFLYDISHSIQKYVEKNGFSVVRQFVGHGIGRELHEEPEIPNYGLPHQGERLKSGMVLAIEPMVNMGTWESEILDNGWTAVTKDRLPSAHFEHTVAITSKEPRILTKIYG